MDFQQATRVFPANFINAIMIGNIYTKSYFHFCQKQNYKTLPYIIIKPSEHMNIFSRMTFIFYSMSII